jgi:hypothetical protein
MKTTEIKFCQTENSRFEVKNLCAPYSPLWLKKKSVQISVICGQKKKVKDESDI